MMKIFVREFTHAHTPPPPFDKQLLFDFCFTKNGVPKLNPEKVTGKSIRTETST